MATLEELVVSLTAETSGLRAEMASAAKATSDATSKMDEALQAFSENSGKNLNFFQQSMATMAGMLGSELVLGAFDKVKEGIKFVYEELAKGAEAANKEELALTRLANSLSLTGHYSKDALDDLKAFSGQMEAQTGVADDVIQSNLATLSSLTKLDKDGLKQAEQAALDMSTAMGVDLNTAVNMIAKGINGHVEAFGKMGIAIQEGGSKAENLSNIMKGLANTQGSAAAATQTMEGLVKKATNSYENWTESIATAVTHNQAIKEVLNVVSDAFNQATDDADANNMSYQELVAEGVILLLKTLSVLAISFDAVGRVGTVIVADIEAAFAGLGMVVTGVLKLFDDSYEESFNAFGEQAKAAHDKAEAAFTENTMLGNITVKLDEMANAAEVGFDKIKAGADGSVEPTVKAGKAVAELSAQQANYQKLILEFTQNLADQGNALQGYYDFELEALKTGLDAKLVTTDEYYAARTQALADQQAAEDLQLDNAQATGKLKEGEYQAAKLALARKQTLDMQKLGVEETAAKKKQQETQLSDLASIFGQISALSESHNSALAAIGKAAAISQATIQGYVAVQTALASAPPPFNFALAALVGVAAAANVAKISGVALAQGGVVKATPGGVQATIGEGGQDEAVIPLNKLPSVAASIMGDGGGQGGGPITIELSLKDGLMDMIEAKINERRRLGISLLVTS